MLPHVLGLIGELLNCLGAIILVVDIFFFEKRQRELKALEEMSRSAREFDSRAQYKSILVASPDFAGKVQNRHAVHLAYLGTGLLVLGFILLALYHWLEIRNI